MVVLRELSDECSSCPLAEVHESDTVLVHRLGNQAANSGWISTAIRAGRDEQAQLLLFREMAGLLVLTLEESYADPEGESFREKQLMKFLEDGGNALVEIDNRRRLTSVNKGAVALLGQKLYGYLGRPIEELIDTGYYGKFQQACSRVMHSLNSEHIDVFLKDWEGDLYKVSLELHPNRSSRGETVGLYALIKGVSDKNPVLDALRESEQRFIDLFEKAPAGYQSLDEEGYFIEVNQQWLDLLGYEKDEVLGRWFGDFLEPSYRETFRERFPLFKERGKIHSELQMLRKDGESRFVAFEGRIGYKDDGSFKQTHCLLTDITEQRKSEELLKKNEQYFKSLFNFLNSGITILEPDKECGGFLIRNMNPSGELINRVNLVDVQGRAYSDVFPEAERSGLLESIRECCLTGRSQYIPLKEYKDERISIFLESYVAKLPSDEIMLIYDDRTSQVQMEKRVRQSEKMEAIGHLAGGIAHDFNNILTGILGFTELIRMKKEDSADILDYLDKIEGAGGRARKLVQQILSFSRQDMGRQELFLLKPLLQESLEFLKSVIPSTVVIEGDLADKVPPVQGDPGGIREILLNLSSNASFAMNDRGVLRIALSRIEASEAFEGALGQSAPGSYALLSVEDDGCGMSRDVLDHIFEPYYTTREVGDGSGMGLPMVFGILKNHSANIQVFSTPGAGSIFKMYFPLLADEDEEDQTKKDPTEGQAESILVIDDEQMNCTLYREFLERLGYEVTDFLNPLEAFEWLRSGERAVDLVISDQTMPEMTGTDLCLRIREDFPELPVLICSGFSPEVNEDNFRKFGASGFIAKPFEFSDLADQIRSLLD
jgi:PAS domain S-box-containing protein